VSLILRLVAELCRARSQADIIQDQVQRLSHEFEEALCGRSGRGYLTLLCIGLEAHHQNGTSTKARDYMMGREIELRKIQKALEKYKRMAEETDGIDDERQRINEVISRVCQVIDWIDDIIWNLMVDPADTVRRFRAEELRFQIESTLTTLNSSPTYFRHFVREERVRKFLENTDNLKAWSDCLVL
jgi:hypothetical protein